MIRSPALPIRTLNDGFRAGVRVRTRRTVNFVNFRA